jgi:uncharacterized protein with FMN-binding domain
MTETLIAVAVIVVLVGFAIGRRRPVPRPLTDEEKIERRRQYERARAIQLVNDGQPYEPSPRHWWM